jgi:dipeptidyl aminopeptidase/acylaminoacyl peptidase
MGHSWGGFWVQFALSHSDLIAVGECHNGGTIVEPGTYSITGSRRIRQYEEHIMGGPPFGETLSNYVAFSPSQNANRIKAPLLIQDSDSEAPIQMELYSALRRNVVPVEFIIYPNEFHVFTQPASRYSAMGRTMDWFNFWLQRKEDSSPAKREQYAHWQELRKQFDARGEPTDSR